MLCSTRHQTPSKRPLRALRCQYNTYFCSPFRRRRGRSRPNAKGIASMNTTASTVISYHIRIYTASSSSTLTTPPPPSAARPHPVNNSNLHWPHPSPCPYHRPHHQDSYTPAVHHPFSY